MINVQFSESILSEEGAAPVSETLLEEAGQAALEYGGADRQAELTLVLSDDETLQALNLQYLEIDAPTDVLSFPSGDTDLDSDVVYLGDIIISYPRSLAQAAAGGHPVSAELQLLVVHGVLHLLGHDHADDEQQAAMWAAQAEILKRLGSPISGPAA